MWEKSVANDDNDCNDDNEECDAGNPNEKPNGNATSLTSRERLSINVFDNQELFIPTVNYNNNGAINTQPKNESEDNKEKTSPQFYCSQNGFFIQNQNFEECSNQEPVNNFQAISSIKPSNTYPIIKDLNKLRSMSLPSMAVGGGFDDKNDDFNSNINDLNPKFDKKFDDDGDNNAGGGYSNNENYSFNLFNANGLSSSHRYANNNFLNEKGINNSNSNTNDICSYNEREFAIRESVSVISSKNDSQSSKNLSKGQTSSDIGSKIEYINGTVNKFINANVNEFAKNDDNGKVEDEEEEEDEDDEDNEDEEDDEEEEEESVRNIKVLPPTNASFTRKDAEINGNCIRKAPKMSSNCESSLSKSHGSSKQYLSYAPNGNIISRANIVVSSLNNCDQSSLTKSSSSYYYYTTASQTSNAIIKSKTSPSKVLTNTVSSASSKRRTSTSNSSRSSLSNISHLNNIPVLSFPKMAEDLPSHEIQNKSAEKLSFSPMSQSSSDSSSSSSCRNYGNNVYKQSEFAYSPQMDFKSDHSPKINASVIVDDSDSVIPITPPTTPPPLVEIVSNRRKRFFVK